MSPRCSANFATGAALYPTDKEVSAGPERQKTANFILLYMASLAQCTLTPLKRNPCFISFRQHPYFPSPPPGVILDVSFARTGRYPSLGRKRPTMKNSLPKK